MSLRFRLLRFTLILSLLFGLGYPALVLSEEWELQSVSVRQSVSEQTLLGKDAPERFDAYDFSINLKLPWQNYSASGWGVGSRLMLSAGLLDGPGKDGIILSAMPEITFGSQDNRFIFDLGIGGALFSRHRFRNQDYGGIFQFALTAGITIPLPKDFGVGYRFQHYSDAALHGSDSIGADLHMIELSYRL